MGDVLDMSTAVTLGYLDARLPKDQRFRFEWKRRQLERIAYPYAED